MPCRRCSSYLVGQANGKRYSTCNIDMILPIIYGHLTMVLSLLRWARITSSHAVIGRAPGLETPLGTGRRSGEIEEEGLPFVGLRPAHRHATAPAVHRLSVAALLPR